MLKRLIKVFLSQWPDLTPLSLFLVLNTFFTHEKEYGINHICRLAETIYYCSARVIVAQPLLNHAPPFTGLW